MTCTVRTISLTGLEGILVNIEVDTELGLPAFIMVGLAELAVREAKERVRTAIKNSGFELKLKKTIVNFAPADIRKEGTHLDLPVAIGVLACGGFVNSASLTEFVLIGELSLSGLIRPVKGILPMVLEARSKGVTSIIIPFDNRNEVDFITDVTIFCAYCLSDVVSFLNDEGTVLQNSQGRLPLNEAEHSCTDMDFSDVKGQRIAKRALEIAAAGLHNVLMVGPPGSGKTMLAQRIPTILPTLTMEESIEVTKIYSVAGMLPGTGMITNPPFRNPHHSASTVSIIGGGVNPLPGEISLAHKGVLFLDEFPEHRRTTIEALRQPIEDGCVNITRVRARCIYPARFMLVGAMNPCFCGNYGSEKSVCRCTPNQVQGYVSKISSPILDRMDLHIHVDQVSFSDLNGALPEETSTTIRERVTYARDIQRERFSENGISFNSQMNTKQVKKYCVLDAASLQLLESAFDHVLSSTRSYTRLLKMSRTIADLDGSNAIKQKHVAEALHYRLLERTYWNQSGRREH